MRAYKTDSGYCCDCGPYHGKHHVSDKFNAFCRSRLCSNCCLSYDLADRETFYLEEFMIQNGSFLFLKEEKGLKRDGLINNE